MFTEQEFRDAFRAQVDDEVTDVVGPVGAAPAVPLRGRPRGRVLAAAAATVLVVAGAGIVGAHLLTSDPAPPAEPESVEAVTVEGAVVPDEDVADVTLQSVDGCLAIDPDTLLVVNEPVWVWDGAAGTLRWTLSSQSEGFHLGDTLRLGGQRVGVGELDQPALPASCADFDGDLWLAGTPQSTAIDPPLITGPGLAVATGDGDSPRDALFGGTLDARDGCIMLGDSLLVVGPSWHWDTPRSVLVNMPTGSEFRLGDTLDVGGNGGLVADGTVHGRDVLTLPASCADFAGRAWFAGAQPAGSGTASVTGRQVSELADAIGAAGRAHPEADGGVAYDSVTATFTEWIVEGATGADALRDAVQQAGREAADGLHVTTESTDFSIADQEALSESLGEARRSDQRWPDGIELTGWYSLPDQAFLIAVADRWDDPGVAEYFRERFGDQVVLSSMAPAVPQSLAGGSRGNVLPERP